MCQGLKILKRKHQISEKCFKGIYFIYYFHHFYLNSCGIVNNICSCTWSPKIKKSERRQILEKPYKNMFLTSCSVVFISFLVELNGTKICIYTLDSKIKNKLDFFSIFCLFFNILYLNRIILFYFCTPSRFRRFKDA